MHALQGALLTSAVLLAAWGLAPQPAAWADEAPAASPAPTFEDAQRLAFAGQSAEALQAARALFAAAPTARHGRLLLRVLAATEDSEACAAAIGEEAPPLVNKGLEALLLPAKARASALSSLLKEDGVAACFQLDLARALLAIERPAAARTEAERYVKAADNDPAGHWVLGDALAAKGTRKPAREAYTRALRLHPGHPGAAISLAQLLALKDEVGGREALTQALAIYPGNVALRYALAEELIRLDLLEEATTALQDVLTLPTPKAPTHVRLAEVWRMRRAFDKSAASAEAALKELGAASRMRARALRARAFAHQKKDLWDKAAADYAAAAEADPTWADLPADLAFVHLMTDDLDAAETCIEKALKLDKRSVPAHLNLGILMYLRDKMKPARKAVAYALKSDSQSIPGNRYMGYIMLRAGKPQSAIKYFRRIAEQLPQDSSCMRMIGRCYRDLGKRDEAFSAFQDAVDRDPKDAFAHFDLGRAFEKKEMWDEAQAEYKEAMAAEPSFKPPYLYMAEVLDYIRDEPKEAIAQYEKFLALGGKDPDELIKKRIEALKKAEEDR